MRFFCLTLSFTFQFDQSIFFDNRSQVPQRQNNVIVFSYFDDFSFGFSIYQFQPISGFYLLDKLTFSASLLSGMCFFLFFMYILCFMNFFLQSLRIFFISICFFFFPNLYFDWIF